MWNWIKDMETVTVCEKVCEVIECFDQHLLVQDLDSGAIFIIEYNDLYTAVPEVADMSNVISLRNWKCQKSLKTEKRNLRLK